MTSIITISRASSFSARRCAQVAPTLPAPTTVILLALMSHSVSGKRPGRAAVLVWLFGSSDGVQEAKRRSPIQVSRGPALRPWTMVGRDRAGTYPRVWGVSTRFGARPRGRGAKLLRRDQPP